MPRNNIDVILLWIHLQPPIFVTFFVTASADFCHSYAILSPRKFSANPPLSTGCLHDYLDFLSIIVTASRVFLSTLRDKKRGRHPFTRHTLEFELPVSAACKRKYSDKAEQRRVIVELRVLGWSYREIAEEVGLHWTRVGQILRRLKDE
jgi:hypothetical protein